ncbi:very long chain fatty acid elongase 7-like [Prorops nasuta]|uniref:very long chain fatty acid elongase 7-like n=1 Tax=Prorops nasuta TaxID=863751 RepID=UPI0034CF5144
MATVIRAFLRGYRYLNEDVADPRTKDWFLIGSPVPGIFLLAFYLYFVQKLGPRLMASRPPFKLERIMQMYNVTQIVLSAYLLFKALQLGWWSDYSYVCEPVDFSDTPRAVEVAATVWAYFMVKIVDLLDTVLFVLRKKQNQVSFLHVYHHAGMVMGSWGAVKYLPGGHVTFLGLINSFVHVVMYTHYLLTSLKIGQPQKWKKYITQLQLLQFFLLMVHFGELVWVKDCDFPRWPAAVFIPQNLFMMVLFGDFYYKTYIAKPKAKAQGASKSEQNGVTQPEAANGKPKTQ